MGTAHVHSSTVAIHLLETRNFFGCARLADQCLAKALQGTKLRLKPHFRLENCPAQWLVEISV
eukprot:m.605530 g.605530  ORF g.605530 m.605530 type:complete len:63 (+) comp22464_c0_seq29:789-977(+)